MENSRWILIDTETNGLAAPIHVVELAAQLMCGWTPQGPSFRRLINPDADIAPGAALVHGYTRELLERDGEPPLDVYREFAEYTGALPLVSFNLAFDFDKVLLPEWKRLGCQTVGSRGFCALRLAQRLLDPVPAGNCKLQTLRQYYGLPERGAHTALGDVQTVVDLLGTVLRPIAEERGLGSWDEICRFTEDTWYPSRLTFGKFKGRSFQEARTDFALRSWLEWLAGSTSAGNATMGRWYLERLNEPERSTEKRMQVVTPAVTEQATPGPRTAAPRGVVVFVDPELEQLKQLVDGARLQLADLETQYTKERHAVDVTQSKLFSLLQSHYQKRDRLQLIVSYRQKYLDLLLREGEEEAEHVAEEYEEAKQQSDAEYRKEAEIAADCRQLSDDDQRELNSLWKKLVRLFHPDLVADDPTKQESHQRLTVEINKARDEADIGKLREIAQDPHGYMARNNLGSLDFNDSVEIDHLRSLYEALQFRILGMLESLNELKESWEYELHRLSCLHLNYLEEVAREHAASLTTEIDELAAQAAELERQISELRGEGSPVA